MAPARSLALVIALALLLAACGSGGGSGGKLPGRSGSRGAKLVSELGCTGCHQIGAAGSGGPGPDLTHVGSRLSRAQIAHVLVSPPPGMPSFASQPAADRRAVAQYLSGLR